MCTGFIFIMTGSTLNKEDEDPIQTRTNDYETCRWKSIPMCIISILLAYGGGVNFYGWTNAKISWINFQGLAITNQMLAQKSNQIFKITPVAT